MRTHKCAAWWDGAVLLMGALACQPACGAAFIVKDGQPRADIVIADAPPRAAKLAAVELQDYLFKISGARLPVVEAPATNTCAHIYVGRSIDTDRLNITDKGLKYGAFRMVSGKDYLVLLGHDSDFVLPTYAPRSRADLPRAIKEWDARTGEHWELPDASTYSKYSAAVGLWDYDERGSLNAVYEFLRGLGVRWYMPGALGEVLPSTTTVALPQVDKTVKPDFPYRNLGDYAPAFFAGTRDAILYRLRIGLDPTMGIPGPHGLNGVNGRNEVKNAHPEYFALYGGTRATGGVFFATCLSSKGLFESTVKYARTLFDLYPDMKYISIWPNDGFSSLCQCDLCNGKDMPDRGWNGFLSDYVWDFTERVARELYKTHPDRKIVNGSYGAYALPPEKIAKFSPNVMVGIVQPRKDFVDPETRARFLNIRKGFLDKLAPGNLYIYNHYLSSRPEYGQAGLPIYFPHTIAEDLHSLKGVSQGEFIELAGAGSDMHVPGFNHLNVYVTARYYWDADQDIHALLDEYYSKFYGPAAGEMKAFIEFSEANWPLMQAKAEPIDKALELLTAARRAAGDTLYGQRIDLVVDFVQPLKQQRAKLSQGRPKGMPRAVAVECKGANLTMNGKFDEPFWKDAPVYELKDILTSNSCASKTTFQVAWSDDRSIVFGVRCEDADMQHLGIGTRRKEDSNLWNGDAIELLLETPTHAYYQIAINPVGAVMDVDRQGRMESRWSSCADVATHIGDTFWSMEARIPTGDMMEGGVDPLKKVEGKKPIATAPWFFNVCRQRVRGKEMELSTFSPTGEGHFHVPLRFARLMVKP